MNYYLVKLYHLIVIKNDVHKCLVNIIIEQQFAKHSAIFVIINAVTLDGKFQLNLNFDYFPRTKKACTHTDTQHVNAFY